MKVVSFLVLLILQVFLVKGQVVLRKQPIYDQHVEATATEKSNFKQSENLKNNDSSHKWAVLVAGSKGYFNYRHQADVSHAYQTLVMNGFDPKRIITMMYDDIALSPNNPYPGVILNHPSGYNVYDGIVIDYKGTEVNVANIYYAMTGEVLPAELILTSDAGINEKIKAKGLRSQQNSNPFGQLKKDGKVLQSGENDPVFVYFSDHGAPNVFLTPDGGVVTSLILSKILTDLNSKKKFSKLLFFLESCYSGSMFENKLSNALNIYATTAANAHESSFACYYDDSTKTFLGDLFSVNWIEKIDALFDPETKKISKLNEYITKQTKSSHVMEYGDDKMGIDPVSEFFTDISADPSRIRDKSTMGIPDHPKFAVDSRDATITILHRTLLKETNIEMRAIIEAQIKDYHQNDKKAFAFLQSMITNFAEEADHNKLLLTTLASSETHECMHEVTVAFVHLCGQIDDYMWRHLYMLNNLCSYGISAAQLNMYLAENC